MVVWNATTKNYPEEDTGKIREADNDEGPQ